MPFHFFFEFGRFVFLCQVVNEVCFSLVVLWWGGEGGRIPARIGREFEHKLVQFAPVLGTEIRGGIWYNVQTLEIGFAGLFRKLLAGKGM